MEAQTAPPAPAKSPVLPAPVPAQIASAQAAPTPPAVPAHAAQTAPTAQTPAPALPATDVTSPRRHRLPRRRTPHRGRPGARCRWRHHRESHRADRYRGGGEFDGLDRQVVGRAEHGKTFMRRTRVELKALRQHLGENLHAMKAILARTGRGGNWARYLRSQRIPIATADRLVAEHEATLAPPAKKVLSEEVSTATIAEVQAMARKMAGKLNDILTTQELVYEFMRELVWSIDVAEASYTDLGIELLKVGSDDAPEVDAQVAESANPAPAVP